MLAINRRLKLVAEYVENRRLADIGSDHAYLPIYLAKNNKIDFAVAGEIVEGPHKVSIKNVQEENLVGVIDCRKAAGLDAIELSDNIEVITICGMGGKLIADILEKGKDKLANKPNLVLQPNVGENFVREKLQELGYEITAENIIEEDGHIYEIIVAKPGVMNLSEDEINFGKYLLVEKNELFVKKQKLELSKIEYILNQLEKATEVQENKVEEFKNNNESLSVQIVTNERQIQAAGFNEGVKHVFAIPGAKIDAVFDALDSDYQKFGDLSKRLDDNEKTFDQLAITGSDQERADAQQEAEQISLDISNVISDLSSLDDSNGNYRQTIENLTKLGNWLRNRSDALSEGWKRSVASNNPSQDKDNILAPVDNIRDSSGSSSYQKLFDENYVNWKPQKQ